MRSVAKRIVELGSRLPGLGALRRRRLRNGVFILAYHNIIPEGESPAGERTLHMPQNRFRAHLAALEAHYEVVPLTESTLERRSGQSRPRVVITFDDAYVGALTAGVGELARFGFPATFFVCPGRLGGQTFWWDHLAEEYGGVLPVSVRDRALFEFEGRSELVLAALSASPSKPNFLPTWMTSADEALLRSVVGISGISLAAHSWSHPNLSAVSEADIERELTESLLWIQNTGPAGHPWLGWPYGLDSPLARQVARRVGFAAAFLVSGGWWRPELDFDRFALPRYDVPGGLGAEGLALRLMGFLCP